MYPVSDSLITTAVVVWGVKSVTDPCLILLLATISKTASVKSQNWLVSSVSKCSAKVADLLLSDL